MVEDGVPSALSPVVKLRAAGKKSRSPGTRRSGSQALGASSRSTRPAANGRFWWNAFKISLEDGYEIPPDGASFDPDSIPGYADGDWPAWPARDMLHWMPEEVKNEYGRVDSSVLNGFFLWLDPDMKHEIASALENHVYQRREDDDFVALAYGVA